METPPHSHNHPNVDHRFVLISPIFPHNEAANRKMTHAPTPPQTLFADQRPIGFDKLVPEGRRAPWRFFPRPGASLSVTSGAPLPEASVSATVGMGRACPGHGVMTMAMEGTSKERAVAEVETWIAVTNSCSAPLKFSVGRCPGACSLGHQAGISKGYEGEFMFIVLNRSHRKVPLYGVVWISVNYVAITASALSSSWWHRPGLLIS